MFTIGSDPEVFLRDKEGNLVSSIGLLGGTKKKPVATPHGFIQEDNVTAEFNSRPASSLDEFIENHRLIIQDLNDILVPLDLSVDISGSALFSDELLSHPKARIAGCEPDYNAWTRGRNIPTSYEDTNMRAAGGHLHIGFERAATDPVSRLAFTKALDLELGLPSVILDPDYARREMYGKAGSHRPKFLTKDGFDGIEYRVLSNFWLKSEGLLRFVYKKVQKVESELDYLSELADSISDELVNVINHGNSEDAIILCNSMGVEYA